MSYADLLDTIFMALVDVGRKELDGLDTSALQQYKNCREVREENNKGALILAYKGDDFGVLKERGFICEDPKILNGTYNREKLSNFISGHAEDKDEDFISGHAEDDYALLINSRGVVGWVEEINNNPSGISDARTYGLMPDEILCLNKRTRAGSRTKAAARAALAGSAYGDDDIHAFVKKQSGPNPKMVIEFDAFGARRQSYAGSGSNREIAFYFQEFNHNGKCWNASIPNILDAHYLPKKVASDVPVGQSRQTAVYDVTSKPEIMPQITAIGIKKSSQEKLLVKQ